MLIHTLLLVGSHCVHYSYTYHLSRVGHHWRLLHGMKIRVDRSKRLSRLPAGMLGLLEHAEVKLLRGLARSVLQLILRSLCKQGALDKLRMWLDMIG